MAFVYERYDYPKRKALLLVTVQVIWSLLRTLYYGIQDSQKMPP